MEEAEEPKDPDTVLKRLMQTVFRRLTQPLLPYESVKVKLLAPPRPLTNTESHGTIKTYLTQLVKSGQKAKTQ